MATYAIGDVQGCYSELILLLEKIKFNKHQDRLWFVGDLVNRGPQSLEVMRYVTELPNPPVVVLGNHDLHYLAVTSGRIAPKKTDTLEALLQASDAEDLSYWLRNQKLLHYDAAINTALVHAGIPPQWDMPTALLHAQEVEVLLHSNKYPEFFQHMYGNQPDQWSESLSGWDRLRIITNCFTRMRFCSPSGQLELNYKGPPTQSFNHFQPWFTLPKRLTQHTAIVFGHWAALMGKTNTPNIYAIDTGCVWGNQLTAIRLEDHRLFQVDAIVR